MKNFIYTLFLSIPVTLFCGECFDGQKLILTEQQWKERLSPEQFAALREKGSEEPFTNTYAHNFLPGIYACAGCALPLFGSEAKFDAQTGWPTFFEPICPQNVFYQDPLATKSAVMCSCCDGHLGHVFNDGPPPTGKRYCMNSIALQFIPR